VAAFGLGIPAAQAVEKFFVVQMQEQGYGAKCCPTGRRYNNAVKNKQEATYPAI
jgi:hypothetical protein